MKPVNLQVTSFENQQREIRYWDLTALFLPLSWGHFPSVSIFAWGKFRCSERGFKSQAEHLQTCLLARGYSRSLLKKAYERACIYTCEQLIFATKENIKSDDKVCFIATYSCQFPQIQFIIKKYWFLLTNDNILTNYVTDVPSITYRRSRRSQSLYDQVVSSHFEDPNTLTTNTGRIHSLVGETPTVLIWTPIPRLHFLVE